jgi:hypothetical protein
MPEKLPAIAAGKTASATRGLTGDAITCRRERGPVLDQG